MPTELALLCVLAVKILLFFPRRILDKESETFDLSHMLWILILFFIKL